MTANDVFLTDTNILVYAHDASDTGKQKISMNIIDRCLNGQQALAVSAQNLSEFFSVTTSKNILSKRDAIKTISDIIDFSEWTKINFSHKTTLEAAKISEEYKMSYWDSLIAATMRENNVFKIYTENVKDFKTPWILAVNPFITRKKLTDIKPIYFGKGSENLSEEIDNIVYGKKGKK